MQYYSGFKNQKLICKSKNDAFSKFVYILKINNLFSVNASPWSHLSNNYCNIYPYILINNFQNHHEVVIRG